jgi:hypothetical protein
MTMAIQLVRPPNHLVATWPVRSVHTVEQDGSECDIAHATIATNAAVRHQTKPRYASLKNFSSVMMVAITVLLHGWLASFCSIFSLRRFLVPGRLADCVIFVAAASVPYDESRRPRAGEPRGSPARGSTSIHHLLRSWTI